MNENMMRLLIYVTGVVSVVAVFVMWSVNACAGGYVRGGLGWTEDKEYTDSFPARSQVLGLVGVGYRYHWLFVEVEHLSRTQAADYGANMACAGAMAGNQGYFSLAVCRSDAGDFFAGRSLIRGVVGYRHRSGVFAQAAVYRAGSEQMVLPSVGIEARF